MGFLDVAKPILIPALIAAAIYALLAYIILPLYRNHHSRYAHYLPLDSLSTHTSSIRSRIGSTLERIFLPSHMRWRRELVDGRYGHFGGRESSSGDEELYFGEEEGESMVGFDVGRRERLGRGGRGNGGSGGGIDSERRLSRDLEEGFRDSDDEEVDGEDGRR